MTVPAGYEEITYADIKEGDYLKVEATETSTMFERVTKREGTVSHFTYSREAVLAKEYNSRYLANRTELGQKIYRKVPVFDFPTGIGAVINAREKGGAERVTLIIADTVTDAKDVWRDGQTGMWFTPEGLKESFEDFKLLSEGVDLG